MGMKVSLFVLWSVVSVFTSNPLTVLADEARGNKDYSEEELKELQEKYDIYIPTPHGVDFNNVRISIGAYVGTESDAMLEKALKKYLLDRLTKAGIYRTAQDDHEKTMELLWIVVYSPVDLTCPGKVLYSNSMLLREPVKLTRGSPSHNTIHAVTWRGGSDHGIIKNEDDMTVEKIEKDAEESLSLFIRQYGEKAVIFPKAKVPDTD